MIKSAERWLNPLYGRSTSFYYNAIFRQNDSGYNSLPGITLVGCWLTRGASLSKLYRTAERKSDAQWAGLGGDKLAQVEYPTLKWNQEVVIFVLIFGVKAYLLPHAQATVHAIDGRGECSMCSRR